MLYNGDANFARSINATRVIMHHDFNSRVIATTNESRIPGAAPGFPCLKSAKHQ